MKALLDTHVLLWWLDNPKLLSKKAFDIISNENSIIFVSAVSIWEIVIKQSLGKLDIPDKIQPLIESEGFTELPISFAHAKTVGTLPKLHNDPFDRLLIAQAIHEKLPVITRDSEIANYPISTIKA